MRRKIRFQWDLNAPPSPASFFDTVSGKYASVWRGEPVTVGVSFFRNGVLHDPELASISFIVRPHQKADSSHLYVQRRDGAITDIAMPAFTAGTDQVEFGLGSEVTAAWNTGYQMRRPLWVVIAAVLTNGDRLYIAGWMNLHESSAGVGGGGDVGTGDAPTLPVGLVDRVSTVDATGGAVTVTIPGPAVRQQASIVSGGGQLTVDDELLPEGVSLDRAPVGSFATYSPVEVIFPAGSTGAVSYAALSDLGAIE